MFLDLAALLTKKEKKMMCWFSCISSKHVNILDAHVHGLQASDTDENIPKQREEVEP